MSTVLRRTTIGFLLTMAAGCALGLILGGWGPLVAGSVLTAAALLALLFVRLGAFLLVVVVGYTASHVFLKEITLFHGAVVLNASQAVMVALTVLLGLRVLCDLGMGADLPVPTGAHVIQTAFVGWALLDHLAVGHPEGTVILGRLLAVAVAFYVGYAYGGEERPWILAVLAGAAGVAGLSAAVTAIFFPSPLRAAMLFPERAAGSLGGPVATATVAFAGLPAFIELWVTRRRLLQLAAVAGFGFLGLAVAFTLTRTVLFGLIVFGAVSLALDRTPAKGGWAVRLTRVALPLLLVAGFLAIVPERQLESRLADLRPSGTLARLDPQLGSGRGMIWTAVFAELSKNRPGEWMFGHGLGTTFDAVAKAIHLWLDAHNSYLNILYELGLVGLALYVALILSSLAGLWKTPSDPQRAACVSSWRAYLVAYAASTVMFAGYAYMVGPTWLTWLGVGYALRRAREEPS